MADEGELPNHPVQVQYIIGYADVPGHRDYHLLDAARALMLLGAVSVVTAVGNPDTDATQTFFLGLVTWLLGVCFLSFMPVAGQFPQAEALVGAAIANANAVLRHLQMTPWN